MFLCVIICCIKIYHKKVIKSYRRNIVGSNKIFEFKGFISFLYCIDINNIISNSLYFFFPKLLSQSSRRVIEDNNLLKFYAWEIYWFSWRQESYNANIAYWKYFFSSFAALHAFFSFRKISIKTESQKVPQEEEHESKNFINLFNDLCVYWSMTDQPENLNTK